jgi:YD repeat-containing protein
MCRKTILCVLLLLLSILLMPGCSGGEKTYPVDALLAVETLYDSDGELQKTTQYKYDENGNCIERLVTEKAFTKKEIYTYDAQGNRLCCEGYFGQDTHPTTCIQWQYDAQGRLYMQTIEGNSVAIYEYTENGYCTYVYGHDGSVQEGLQYVTLHTLDAQGRTIEQVSYAADDNGTLAEQPYERFTYVYDDANGGRVSAGSVLRDGNSYERQYAYETISDHTEQHIVYKVSRASKSEESRTTLTYDENGNLLQRTVINHNTGDEYRVDYEYYE